MISPIKSQITKHNSLYSQSCMHNMISTFNTTFDDNALVIALNRCCRHSNSNQNMFYLALIAIGFSPWTNTVTKQNKSGTFLPTLLIPNKKLLSVSITDSPLFQTTKTKSTVMGNVEESYNPIPCSRLHHSNRDWDKKRILSLVIP